MWNWHTLYLKKKFGSSSIIQWGEQTDHHQVSAYVCWRECMSLPGGADLCLHSTLTHVRGTEDGECLLSCNTVTRAVHMIPSMLSLYWCVCVCVCVGVGVGVGVCKCGAPPSCSICPGTCCSLEAGLKNSSVSSSCCTCALTCLKFDWRGFTPTFYSWQWLLEGCMSCKKGQDKSIVLYNEKGWLNKLFSHCEDLFWFQFIIVCTAQMVFQTPLSYTTHLNHPYCLKLDLEKWFQWKITEIK